MRRRGIVSIYLAALLLVAFAGGCASKSGKATMTTATPIPSAGQIAFSQEQGARGTVSAEGGRPLRGAIRVVNTDGSGLGTITTGPGDTAEHPTWSPDGTRVAYQSGLGRVTDTWKFAIFAMNSDGSKRVQLTHPPLGALWPAWSPDGARIAFSAYSYLLDEFRIAVMNPDGSQMTTLTTGYYDYSAGWAPDGRVFFLRTKAIDEFQGNYGDLYVVNSDGTGLVQLTSSKNIGDFAVSPDGSKIAFHDKKARKVMLMPADASTQPTALVDQDFKWPYVGITWAPDGGSLAMACSDFNAYSGSDLYIVNADASNLTKVPNVEYALDPAWRPE